MTYDFNTEQAAAKAMLIEATTLLNEHSIDYAVIGGWVPYLFNAKPVAHPGTYDVDIVLNTSLSKDQVVSALDKMVKSSGYMRAPKNAFQIYRVLNVNGEPLVFHVDFLHRKYADDSDEVTRSWGRYQSISTVGTDVIFTDKEVRSERIEARGVNGEPAVANITFASEVGFLCSKGRSVGTGKRERDAFDIYLVIKQSSDIKKLKERCKDLLVNAVFKASIENMRNHFQQGALAVEKASKFLCAVSDEFKDKSPAMMEMSQTVLGFIDELESTRPRVS